MLQGPVLLYCNNKPIRCIQRINIIQDLIGLPTLVKGRRNSLNTITFKLDLLYAREHLVLWNGAGPITHPLVDKVSAYPATRPEHVGIQRISRAGLFLHVLL